MQGSINMCYLAKDHTFAICAYKESQYLEECIQSVKKQHVLGEIIMVTSTPNEHISRVASKYDVPLLVREGKSNIADDWNFAYQHAETELVTITHQDDVYCEDYLETVLSSANKAIAPLIIFSDYGEIRDGKIVTDNHLLNVKKAMLAPLRLTMLWTSRFIRRRILSLGSAICCPSVTYVKKNLPAVVFEKGYSSDLDWQAWEKLSRLKGSFVYCNKVIMHHRIHQDSATTQIIENSNRTKEDYEMYCRFWPKWIAKILIKGYAKAQKSNTL